MLLKFIICFIAGIGAGLGTGFAGMSAAAVISPMLITFLDMPAYDAVGIALASDVLASPYLERAIMTGITRISKESIFSDLNNLKVITTTFDEYMDSFGFTKKEVFSALEEFNMLDKIEKVKYWYDGFTFGNTTDIYNPWSILNYLDTGKFQPYWANTSSNSLVSKLIREYGFAFEGKTVLIGKSVAETTFSM